MTPDNELEDILGQLQYGTLMADNSEPALTNNFNIALAEINALIKQAEIEARVREIAVLADYFAKSDWGNYDPQQVLQDRLADLNKLNNKE